MSLSKPSTPTKVRQCPEWNWSLFPRGRFNQLVGSSGCGKSVALHYFMSILRPGRIKGYSGSENATEEMENYILPCYCEPEWDDRFINTLEDMYKHQCRLANLKKQLRRQSGGAIDLDILYAFLFDDLGEVEKLMRGKFMQKISFKGRHPEMEIWVGIQDTTMLHPRCHKSSGGTLFYFKQINPAVVEDIWKKRFKTWFPKLPEFVDFYNHYVDNYGILVLLTGGKSSAFEDCVFHIKPFKKEDIPKFVCADQMTYEECQLGCMRARAAANEEEMARTGGGGGGMGMGGTGMGGGTAHAQPNYYSNPNSVNLTTLWPHLDAATRAKYIREFNNAPEGFGNAWIPSHMQYNTVNTGFSFNPAAAGATTAAATTGFTNNVMYPNVEQYQYWQMMQMNEMKRQQYQYEIMRQMKKQQEKKAREKRRAKRHALKRKAEKKDRQDNEESEDHNETTEDYEEKEGVPDTIIENTTEIKSGPLAINSKSISTSNSSISSPSIELKYAHTKPPSPPPPIVKSPIVKREPVAMEAFYGFSTYQDNVSSKYQTISMSSSMIDSTGLTPFFANSSYDL